MGWSLTGALVMSFRFYKVLKRTVVDVNTEKKNMLLSAKQTDRTGAQVYWMLGYGLLTGLKTQVGAEQPGATQTRLASLTAPQTEKLWN